MHLLHTQQRLLVRAMLTLLVGEWLGGAQRVPAVVELEEVVVEMVRAYSWEAPLKESNVGVHFPLSSNPEGLDRHLNSVVARLCYQDWALHRKPKAAGTTMCALSDALGRE